MEEYIDSIFYIGFVNEEIVGCKVKKKLPLDNEKIEKKLTEKGFDKERIDEVLKKDKKQEFNIKILFGKPFSKKELRKIKELFTLNFTSNRQEILLWILKFYLDDIDSGDLDGFLDLIEEPNNDDFIKKIMNLLETKTENLLNLLKECKNNEKIIDKFVSFVKNNEVPEPWKVISKFDRNYNPQEKLEKFTVLKNEEKEILKKYLLDLYKKKEGIQFKISDELLSIKEKLNDYDINYELLINDIIFLYYFAKKTTFLDIVKNFLGFIPLKTILKKYKILTKQKTNDSEFEEIIKEYFENIKKFSKDSNETFLDKKEYEKYFPKTESIKEENKLFIVKDLYLPVFIYKNQFKEDNLKDDALKFIILEDDKVILDFTRAPKELLEKLFSKTKNNGIKIKDSGNILSLLRKLLNFFDICDLNFDDEKSLFDIFESHIYSQQFQNKFLRFLKNNSLNEEDDKFIKKIIEDFENKRIDLENFVSEKEREQNEIKCIDLLDIFLNKDMKTFESEESITSEYEVPKSISYIFDDTNKNEWEKILKSLGALPKIKKEEEEEEEKEFKKMIEFQKKIYKKNDKEMDNQVILFGYIYSFFKNNIGNFEKFKKLFSYYSETIKFPTSDDSEEDKRTELQYKIFSILLSSACKEIIKKIKEKKFESDKKFKQFLFLANHLAENLWIFNKHLLMLNQCYYYFEYKKKTKDEDEDDIIKTIFTEHQEDLIGSFNKEFEFYEKKKDNFNYYYDYMIQFIIQKYYIFGEVDRKKLIEKVFSDINLLVRSQKLFEFVFYKSLFDFSSIEEENTMVYSFAEVMRKSQINYGSSIKDTLKKDDNKEIIEHIEKKFLGESKTDESQSKVDDSCNNEETTKPNQTKKHRKKVLKQIIIYIFELRLSSMIKGGKLNIEKYRSVVFNALTQFSEIKEIKEPIYFLYYLSFIKCFLEDYFQVIQNKKVDMLKENFPYSLLSQFLSTNDLRNSIICFENLEAKQQMIRLIKLYILKICRHQSENYSEFMSMHFTEQEMCWVAELQLAPFSKFVYQDFPFYELKNKDSLQSYKKMEEYYKILSNNKFMSSKFNDEIKEIIDKDYQYFINATFNNILIHTYSKEFFENKDFDGYYTWINQLIERVKKNNTKSIDVEVLDRTLSDKAKEKYTDNKVNNSKQSEILLNSMKIYLGFFFYKKSNKKKLIDEMKKAIEQQKKEKDTKTFPEYFYVLEENSNELVIRVKKYIFLSVLYFDKQIAFAKLFNLCKEMEELFKSYKEMLKYLKFVRINYYQIFLNILFDEIKDVDVDKIEESDFISKIEDIVKESIKDYKKNIKSYVQETINFCKKDDVSDEKETIQFLVTDEFCNTLKDSDKANEYIPFFKYFFYEEFPLKENFAKEFEALEENEQKKYPMIKYFLINKEEKPKPSHDYLDEKIFENIVPEKITIERSELLELIWSNSKRWNYGIYENSGLNGDLIVYFFDKIEYELWKYCFQYMFMDDN